MASFPRPPPNVMYGESKHTHTYNKHDSGRRAVTSITLRKRDMHTHTQYSQHTGRSSLEEPPLDYKYIGSDLLC